MFSKRESMLDLCVDFLPRAFLPSIGKKSHLNCDAVATDYAILCEIEDV